VVELDEEEEIDGDLTRDDVDFLRCWSFSPLFSALLLLL
jgi:hypothetical protein